MGKDRAEEILEATWKNFERWVIQQRKAKGWTQSNLGDELGMRYQQLSRIEKGASTKRVTVIRIAEALDVDPNIALEQAGWQVPKQMTTGTSNAANEPRFAPPDIEDADGLWITLGEKIRHLPPPKRKRVQRALIQVADAMIDEEEE